MFLPLEQENEAIRDGQAKMTETSLADALQYGELKIRNAFTQPAHMSDQLAVYAMTTCHTFRAFGLFLIDNSDWHGERIALINERLEVTERLKDLLSTGVLAEANFELDKYFADGSIEGIHGDVSNVYTKFVEGYTKKIKTHEDVYTAFLAFFSVVADILLHTNKLYQALDWSPKE